MDIAGQPQAWPISPAGLESILVATSIAPNDRLDVQKAAVASWQRLGLRIVSMNAPREIERLAPEFDGVEFVPQIRTAAAYAGRPVVFISDILHFLRSSGTPICGIVNSDIVFAETDRLVPCLAHSARGAFVYGPRLEVSDLDAPEGRLDPYGFDFFFFDRDLSKVFGETHFCLGMPFWDHWLPLAAILAGCPVNKLMTTVARHVAHPTSRDESFFMFNHEFASFALERMQAARVADGGHLGFGRDFPMNDHAALWQAATADDPSLAADERLSRLHRLASYYDELTRYVIRFLDRHSTRIFL